MDEYYERVIKTLINASIEIKRIYQRLAVLEQNNKKNTKEYYKLIDNLKIMQEIEDIYYQKLDISIKTFYDFVYEYEFYPLEQIDEDVIERISNHLILRSENAKDEESAKFYKKYYKKQLKSLRRKDINLNQTKMTLIERHIYSNILNTYLYLLELKGKTKPYLIQEKYRVFNMYKHKENEFIKENFNAHDIYYIDSKTASKFLNINESTYIEYINNLIKKEYITQLDKILSIKDYEYEKDFDETKKLSQECFIRALFTLADNKTIDEMNYSFHELIDNKDNIEKYLDSNKSIELIINSFKSIKRDRRRIKILSIGIQNT